MVFQFSCVPGATKKGKDYLANLERDSVIGKRIDVHTYDIGPILNLRKAKTFQEQKMILKLLIGAIRTDYDHLDGIDDDYSDAAPYDDDDDDDEIVDDEDDSSDDDDEV